MKFTINEFIGLVKSDIKRHSEIHQERLSLLKAISIFLLPSLQSLFLYRLAHYFTMHKIKMLPRLLYALNIILYSADIFPTTEIGPSFYMPHPTGIFIYGKVGKRCSFYAQAAIGGELNKDNKDCTEKDFPVLGDDVSLGCRSAILGPVKVGSGSIIGAYALVLKDVPKNAVVVGIPGKVIKYKENSKIDGQS